MKTIASTILLPLATKISSTTEQKIITYISAIDGIKKVEFDSNPRSLHIQYTEKSALQDALQFLSTQDISVSLKKLRVPITGLSCAACAGSAQSTVSYLSGVVDASVNFASAELYVEFIPEVTTIESIQKAVQAIGFDILIDTTDAKEQLQQVEEIQHEHYKALRRDTLWASVFTAPLIVIAMAYMDMPYSELIMWLLSTPVLFIFGSRFFIKAWQLIRRGSASMDTLVALSTGIAYLFSVFNMVFADFWIQKGLEAHVYFEAAAVIITFILIGRLLEERAKGNTSLAIKKLMGLQPTEVTIVNAEGVEKIIPINDLRVDDVILVKPGEKIAVDGVVLSGQSYIDESMLSGEPIPVLKKEHELVYAGTINQKGSFQFKATKVGNNTMLAYIIRTVQEAQASKAPVQKLADAIAQIFVPTVIGIAIVTFVLWLFIADHYAFESGLLAAITVLVIACPCALGLATPTAIMVGIGKGAQQGILIKDAQSIELAKKITAVLLDKTGTITEGKPTVNSMQWATQSSEYENILYSIEKRSEHPLADAVVNYLHAATSVPLDDFESITGRGVRAVYKGEEYFVGNMQLLEEHTIKVPQALTSYTNLWEKEANTVIWFATGSIALSAIAITDTIKPHALEAIRKLQHMGIDVHMLTGDSNSTAKVIAQATGITNFTAQMLPQDKADYVKTMQQQGHIVAMVGDGINDSTALATADISIAMGKGTDIAMDIAKMTIISSDLTKISQAIKLSKQTVSTIRQNLFWAFIYNIIGIPIAAGILYPFTGFMLNPMIAGAVMAFSSVSVVTNSLLLKLKKITI